MRRNERSFALRRTAAAAFNINSIYAADGGANFDARVCIELPWRHDSSEK
jgi:hypothetical protein